jgi:hypothetical protein
MTLRALATQLGWSVMPRDAQRIAACLLALHPLVAPGARVSAQTADDAPAGARTSQPTPLPVAPSDTAGAPPAPLACLARHYRVEPVFEEGVWQGRLPDGRLLRYDDGRTKSVDERLDAPDLEDVFSIPYRTGPIRPVETAGDDPGRIRMTALLDATFGAPPGSADLVQVPFFEKRLRVHRAIAPALRRAVRRLERAVHLAPKLGPVLRRPSGAFVVRTIAGTERPSAHAYGIAVDLDASRGEYWRWQQGGGKPRWHNRVPQAVVDAFEAEGFIWGGRWYHYDTIHFEYRPELLDPSCAP